MRFALLSLAAAGAFVTMCAPAQAMVYDFTITTSQDHASGQFTVADGSHSVTGVTGEVDGSTISGLSGYGDADNLLSATTPYVDRAGVAFTAGDLAFNIFDNYTDQSTGLPVYSFCNSSKDGGCTGGDANAAPVANFTVAAASAVPEPATWGMMIVGLGVVGGLMRRARKSDEHFTRTVRAMAEV